MFIDSYIYKCCTGVHIDTRALVVINIITVKPNIKHDYDKKIDVIENSNITFHVSLRNGTNMTIGWDNVEIEDQEKKKIILEQDRLKLISVWEKHHKEL